MLIEVAETHPALPGRPTATIVAANGEKFDIWPNQLSSVRVGVRYEVECTEKVVNGRTYRKITKATPINGAANGNGATKPAPQTSQDSSGQFARSNDPGDLAEAEVVGRGLHALILKGEVTYNQQKIAAAMTILCEAWRATRNPQ